MLPGNSEKGINMHQHIIKLSKAGKMPCSSFSLPARACKTGSKLAKVKGSVCSTCYAKKGNYIFPNVKNTREHNLAALPNESNVNSWLSWVNSMIDAIKNNDSSGYFRWHDSGDIQSLRHLEALSYIAYKLPNIKFWLPTKEKGFLSKYKKNYIIPDNLIIRLSAPMIDGVPPSSHEHTSTVHINKPHGYQCPAPSQGGVCMRCRACWDNTVHNVSYSKH